MSPPLEKSQDAQLPIGNSFYLSFMRTLYQQDITSFLIVFLSILAALKLNQYLFFNFNTSPAVILLPSGIALAATYLKGSRMWLPIALAWFLASSTSPAHPVLFVVITATIAYPLQATIGGHILRRLGFLGTLSRTRCALILVAVALTLPTIAPSISTVAQWLTHSLSAAAWITWSRAWAGGVMSIMILTPLITTWANSHQRKTPRELAETVIALLVLTLLVYLTFWTNLPQANVFVILYVLFAVLFWIGLRLHPRVTSAALFLVWLFGMAGSIIAHPGTIALNQQLFADELFIILITPIFFILSSLVEERRETAKLAEIRTQELEEANRKLSREDQAKNEFLATLAHELRNPLAPVVSSLELMKIKLEELNRPDLVRLVEVAGVHNAALTHLLDDLLDISRISQRKFKLKKESVELRAMIETVQRTVSALYASLNHTLLVSLPAEILWIETDPLRFEQILINLLNNAAKYTPPGGTIELSVLHDPKKGLRISVKDNGIGIEPHMLSKIFEPFIQSSDGSAGLGIGLSLTKRLVELHGGEVWAESRGLGLGSDFVVVLPEVESVQLPLTASVPRRKKGFLFNKESKRSAARRILIVDDNQAAAEALGKLLEHHGHTVVLAHDGPSAMNEMSQNEAQIVLLDIGMPGQDGYAVAKNLRQVYGNNPLVLVALTGFGTQEDKTKAKEAGFNYHLTKPVSIEDVEDLLAKNSAKL